MDEKDIRAKIISLILKLSPPDKLEEDKKIWEATNVSTKSCLNHLGVCLQYLLLDCEASKRETEYLRKLLEEESS